MTPGRLVVIGCSWGGLDGLRRILPGLPVEFPASLVVVQHRGVDARDAGLADVLARRSTLPVRTVTDKDELDTGVVYIAPPAYHLLVEPGHLALSTDELVQFSRPSIDVRFDSAADAYGAAVVGVILSGANADGAAGLRAICDRGGYGLVQDPAGAERDEMPRAAIKAGGADRVLPVSEIAAALVACCGTGAAEVRAR